MSRDADVETEKRRAEKARRAERRGKAERTHEALRKERTDDTPEEKQE